MKKRIFNLVAIILSLVMLSANGVELKKDHPQFYVVQPGDTLWDISQSFLKTPWLWPEIWHVNEQVDNPHLIFPGDVLSLVYIDGQPKITKSNKYPNGTIKLTPKIRELSAAQAITTIPLDAILPFLSSARVLNDSEFETAPYIVGSDSDRLLAAQEHKVYVRGIQDQTAEKFSFFRRGVQYTDPMTGEYLGTEAIHLGEGQKIMSGDPTVIRVKSSREELRKGDRLWPTNDQQIRPVYFPRAPQNFNGGQIISVYGGVQYIGQYDIVIINRGERENMEVGYVLDIYQRGKVIKDRVAARRDTNLSDHVKLPDEKAGTLMIFRTFEKVSLALVLKSSRSIHVGDNVKTPL